MRFYPQKYNISGTKLSCLHTNNNIIVMNNIDIFKYIQF